MSLWHLTGNVQDVLQMSKYACRRQIDISEMYCRLVVLSEILSEFESRYKSTTFYCSI